MVESRQEQNSGFPRLAIVPAAGLGTRFLPATKQIAKELIPIVNIPGIQLVAEEAAAAGAEEMVVIISEDKQAVVDYFQINESLQKILQERDKDTVYQQLTAISKIIKVTAVQQDQPLGLGHAVAQAEKLLTKQDQAVCVLLPDDLVLPQGIFKQMQQVWNEYRGTVLCAFSVAPSEVSAYGIFDVADTDDPLVKRVVGMVEKPSPNAAPSNLAAAGRYILDRKIFEIFKEVKPGVGGEVQLTDAIEMLIEQDEPVHLVVHEGIRHDIGNPLGLIKASVDFALQEADYQDNLQAWLQQRLGNTDN